MKKVPYLVGALASLPASLGISTCNVTTAWFTTTVTGPTIYLPAPLSAETCQTILPTFTEIAPIQSSATVPGGPYYFSVTTLDNGVVSTVWLNDNTPTASFSSFVLQTSTVVIKPAPSQVVVTSTEVETIYVPINSKEEVATSQPLLDDTVTTVRLTITKTLQNTVTSVVSRERPPYGSYNGPGSSGWNATATPPLPSSIVYGLTGTALTVTAPSASAPSGFTYTVSARKASSSLILNGTTTGFSRPVYENVDTTSIYDSINITATLPVNSNSSLVLPTEVAASSERPPYSFEFSPISSRATAVSMSILPISASSNWTWTAKSTSHTSNCTRSIYPETWFPSLSTVLDTPSRSTEPPFPLENSTSTFSVTATGMTATRTSTANLTATNAAKPEHCGEWGNFTLTWDDLPTFTPPGNGSNPENFPPVFNPYHHMFFANGFVYVSERYSPFTPASMPEVAIFFPNLTDPGSAFTNTVKPGEIGAGPRRSVDAYWFNAYNVSVGCDNTGPSDCLVRVNAFAYDSDSDEQELAGQIFASVPPCPAGDDCALTFVEFPENWTGLSGIQFEAFVDNEESQIFMLDSLALGWWNNSCEAGLERIMHRK